MNREALLLEKLAVINELLASPPPVKAPKVEAVKSATTKRTYKKSVYKKRLPAEKRALLKRDALAANGAQGSIKKVANRYRVSKGMVAKIRQGRAYQTVKAAA